MDVPVVDTWISLLVAGTLLLVGFAASLAFHRFRIPDFILLLFLGVALGLVPIAPFGPGLVGSLAPLLPIFTQLTIAFILFEGGLTLRLREIGRSVPAIVAHSLIAMGLTAFLTWLVLTRALGISDVTALVVAVAFAGPSASIALSFASRMQLDPQAESAIVLEGVLTNVVAVIGVLFVLGWFGTSGGFSIVPYLAGVGEAVVVGSALGLAWGRVVQRLQAQRFIYIATVALAIVVYAAAEGFFGGNGAVAVFVLGMAVGYRRAKRSKAEAPVEAESAPLPADGVIHELARFVEATDGPSPAVPTNGSRPGPDLRHFQSEITFALRTFFFVYLGLLLAAQRGGVSSIVASVLIVGVFLLGRLPSTAALGWGLVFSPRDSRAVFASMARGMTDVVLVLLAAESGILPSSEVQFVLGIVPGVVLVAAIVSAMLVVWAGRSPGEAEAKALYVKATTAANGDSPDR